MNWATLGVGFVAAALATWVAVSKEKHHAKVAAVILAIGVYAWFTGATVDPPTSGNPIDEGKELFHNVPAIVASPDFLVGLLGAALGVGLVLLVNYLVSD
jgi:uncharacterized membrane protein YfcA